MTSASPSRRTPSRALARFHAQSRRSPAGPDTVAATSTSPSRRQSLPKLHTCPVSVAINRMPPPRSTRSASLDRGRNTSNSSDTPSACTSGGNLRCWGRRGIHRTAQVPQVNESLEQLTPVPERHRPVDRAQGVAVRGRVELLESGQQDVTALLIPGGQRHRQLGHVLPLAALSRASVTRGPPMHLTEVGREIGYGPADVSERSDRVGVADITQECPGHPREVVEVVHVRRRRARGRQPRCEQLG